LSLTRLTSLTAFGKIAAQIADQNPLRDLAIIEVAREFPVWIENGDLASWESPREPVFQSPRGEMRGELGRKRLASA